MWYKCRDAEPVSRKFCQHFVQTAETKVSAHPAIYSARFIRACRLKREFAREGRSEYFCLSFRNSHPERLVLRVSVRKRKICTLPAEEHVAILRRIHLTINRQLGKQRARSPPASARSSNIKLPVSVRIIVSRKLARSKNYSPEFNRQLRSR